MRKTLAVWQALTVLTVLTVAGLAGLSAGCGGPKGTAEYKSKTDPVIAMFDKLKADGAGSNIKPYTTDFQAAQAAFTKWDQSLTDNEKKLDSATNLHVAFLLFSQANIEMTRTNKPAPDMLSKANEALTEAKKLLADNK